MLILPVHRIRSTQVLSLVSLLALGATPSAQGSPRIPVGGVGTVPFDPPLPCTCPAWMLNGNLGTNPATQFLGTIDNKTLSLRVFNQRTMQYAYASNGGYHGMNVLGGPDINTITSGVIGATIAGGGQDFFVGVDYPNAISADFGTIGGGGGNQVTNQFGTVSGGQGNTASGDTSNVGGGSDNVASGMWSIVGGGKDNASIQQAASILGGSKNISYGFYSAIGGGVGNSAGGNAATIGGGDTNSTMAKSATVAGGEQGTVQAPYGAIGGGYFNTVAADFGTIPGGEFNIVGDVYGFAAGRQAQAMHPGAFVWADSTNAPFASSLNDEFSVRAAGGARFFSNAATTTGVFLAPNAGAWSTVSDRNAKKDIEPVDGREVLARLSDVPISTWSYRGQDGVRHMGPMAQDFYAAFALGLGEKTIDTVDPDGVALAAIQGLNTLVREQHDQIAALEARIAELERKRE